MNSLVVRLTIGFMLLTVFAIGMITITMNRSVDENFRRFLDDSVPLDYARVIAFAENYYAETGSWDGIDQARFIQGPGRNNPNRNDNNAQRVTIPGQLQTFVLTDENYRIIWSADPAQRNTRLDPVLRDGAVPMAYNDEVIGYFTRQTRGEAVLAQTEQAFLDDINSSLQVVSIGTAGVAVVLAVFLAFWMSRPLRHLKAASQQVAAGQLNTRAPVTGATEIREVATAFNQMTQTLARSEQIRRQMFSDIAHELRTPISVMRGQLEGMLDGVFPTTEAQIGVIYNQNLHLGRLVNDLWTLTRAETGSLELQKQPVQIDQLLHDTLQAFSALAQDEGIELRFSAPEQIGELSADSGRLRQIFSNLLANAIRHTRAGGRVLLNIAQDPGWTTIDVSDTGEGMSPDVAAQIFNRFYRGEHGDQQGAGLGLAITRELVHLHGGQIGVESKLGVGTTFTVRLPNTI